MAAGPSWMMMLLVMLLGGGGSDLLDYVPSDFYWKKQNVQVTAETLLGELKPVTAQDISKFIPDLDSADPQVRDKATKGIESVGPAALPELKKQAQSDEQEIAGRAKALIQKIEANQRPKAVRRLMAIRTLGEMKSKEAEPVLKGLLKSDERFVADYAQAALDRIAGREPTRKRPTETRDDVWMLPDQCRAVAQLWMPPTTINIQEALKSVGTVAGQDPKKMMDDIAGNAMSLAERLGNMRFDGVTVGLSGDINNNTGFVVVVARGTYDAHGVADLFHQEKEFMPATIGTTEVFTQERTSVFFPSDERAVMITGPPGANVPVEQLVSNVKNRGGKLKGETEIANLIEAVPAGQQLWGVMKVTPSYAQAPVLAFFKTLQLTSEMKDAELHVLITGDGTDPEKTKDAVSIANTAIQQGVAGLQQIAQFVPQMKAVAEKLQTFKAEVVGKDARLTGNVGKSDSALFLLPMMAFGVHAEAAPVAPPPAPAPPAPPAPPK